MTPSPPVHTTPHLDPKWWVLLSVGVGTFMSALDGSIVNTILPVIRLKLGSDLPTIEWVITVYLLVVSGLLLPVGRWGDLRGHKRVYAWGFVLFVLASALCGAAWNAGALIAFRALQALGSAMLFASAPAILTRSFPPTQRGRALGLAATMTYLGLTVGPALGGWMTDHLGWRSVFYVNLPVGALALALCLVFIPRAEPKAVVEAFDVGGAATFIAGLVSLLLALNRGHDWGWGAPGIVGLLALAGLLLGAFLMLERRAAHPMLDLTLFGNPVFSGAVAAAVLNYMAVMSILFLMPFYLIDGRGLPPSRSGLLFTAQALVMAIAAPISGTLSDRIGSRRPAAVGMAILALGIWMLAAMAPDAPLGLAAAAMGVTGLGTGIFIAPNNSAMLGAAPPYRQGIASGILATARNAGMALGVGLSGAVFFTLEARKTPAALFEGVSAGLWIAGGLAVLGCVASALRAGGQDAVRR